MYRIDANDSTIQSDSQPKNDSAESDSNDSVDDLLDEDVRSLTDESVSLGRLSFEESESSGKEETSATEAIALSKVQTVEVPEDGGLGYKRDRGSRKLSAKRAIFEQ